MNRIEFQKSCKRGVWAILLAIAMIALPLCAALAGTTGKGRHSGTEEGPSLNIVPRVTVNIEKKMLEAVITNTGERFKLSSQTIIVGLNGRQVSIRKMRVPCDAEISFQVENGVRVAQRIKMLQIGKDSSWHWTSDKPD